MMTFFSHKIFRRNVILVSSLLVVMAGYFYFVNTVRHDHYQLFNPKTTVTWAQSGKNLYRIQAYHTVDNMLLSEDRWRNYVLSLRVSNPEDCGLIYDYLDNVNYSFFYFRNSLAQTVSGQLKNGKLQDIKPVILDFSRELSVVLQKEKDAAVLTINGRAIFDVPTAANQGKIGFIINTVPKSPTFFHDVVINGTLGNGQRLVNKVNSPSVKDVFPALLGFLPFYLTFIILIIFASRLMPDMVSRDVILLERFKKYFPALIHIFLAVAFFWPFITTGAVAVFSYDNLGEILPLFYYAKHNFANILHGQPPWLWNPLIQNGFPFYSNHWDMIYYPLNWPVFLVSDKYLLNVLTLKSFIEVALMGIFAYGFFVRELGSRRWALFSSVAYQMCSLLIFTMSIFPATSLYFSMTVYLYVLWSSPERKNLSNFLLLSLSVVLILTSANVAFIFYACLSLGVVSIYRFLTVKNGRKFFWVTAAGWTTGILMSSVRIISCLEGVTHGNRLLDNFNTLHDRVYMAIRLFVPEVAGWMGTGAMDVLKSPNLQLIFRQLELPSSNPQNCFFVYFGVLPALLLVASLVMPMKGKAAFWKIYAFITLGIALLLQPLWGILSILSFPLSHYSYHVIILPAGVCTLIGYAAMAWESGQIELKVFQRNMFLCLMSVAAYVIVFITYLSPDLAPMARVILIFWGAAVVLYFTKYFSWPVIALKSLSLTLLIVLTLLLSLSPIPKKELLGTQLILPFLWVCATVMMVFYGQHRNREGRDFKAVLIPLVLAVVIACIIVILGCLEKILSWPDGVRVYSIDVLSGVVRMLLLLQVGLMAFSGFQKNILSLRVMFGVLLVLTAMDLMVFNARFNNITAPFYFKNAFYPKAFIYRDLTPDIREKLDLINYRVNHIDRKDFSANKNLVFNIPTYTGTVGYMTARFSKLLTTFGYPQGVYMLYPEDSTDNARFLDLSAVRYSYDEYGNLLERPSALARLNVIFSAEVILDDERTLERLQSDTFNPQQTVLLSQAVSLETTAAGAAALNVPILKNSPDRIEANVKISSPGVLLFAESYDEGWKIFIDNKLVPVVRANYNFVSCAITQGEHHIQLVYAPAKYKRNIILSLAGLLIFIIAAAGALLEYFKNYRRA